MRRALIILAWLAAAGPALADVVSERPDAVSVTIYRDRPGLTSQITDPEAQTQGLGLISETRTIEVPAGASKISFRGVADGIVPETAKIEGLPSGVVEYDFDFDLLSPGSLIERSIGRPVRLVRTNRRTGKVTEQAAIIRSGPNGIMLEIDGRQEALGCSGEPEKLVFDQLPPGLSDKPTLSLLTRAAAPGRYTVKLTYLATGMDWSADYVARVEPDGRRLDLSGWITLVNRGSTGFADAPTSVVAGRWNRVGGDGTDRQPPEPAAEIRSCWPMGTSHTGVGLATPHLAPPPPPPPMAMMRAGAAGEVVVTGSRIARMTELGDYKLYTLPEPTTVAARQIKQAQLLDQPGVSFARVYTYDYAGGGPPTDAAYEPATVMLRLENKASEGLGKPLPAGTVSVMQPDDRGRLVLAGQKTLDDIPVGQPFDVQLGRAIDVRVRPRVVEDKSLGRGVRRRVIEVEIANDKPVLVRFEFRQFATGRDFRVRSESRRHQIKKGDPVWVFDLKPGAREVLSYTVEQAD